MASHFATSEWQLRQLAWCFGIRLGYPKRIPISASFSGIPNRNPNHQAPKNQQFIINSFNLNLLPKKKMKHTHPSYYIITYNFPKTPSPKPTGFVLFFFSSQKIDLTPPWMATCMATLFPTPKAASGFSLLTITPDAVGVIFSREDGTHPAVLVTFGKTTNGITRTLTGLVVEPHVVSD